MEDPLDGIPSCSRSARVQPYTRANPDNLVFEGNATFVVVERDGVMKVDAEYFAGTFSFVED
jgi:hypothetical protein